MHHVLGKDFHLRLNHRRWNAGSIYETDQRWLWWTVY